MPGIKELKTRIKSIGSTRKITRAMQMVSAAKMRKSQQAALNSRTYSELAWELIGNLSSVSSQASAADEAISESDEIASDAFAMTDKSQLLQSFPQATKTGVIIITTNTGLVGGFNTNVVNTFLKMEKQNTEMVAELFVMGRKAKEFAVRFGKNMKADFAKSDASVKIEDVYPLAKMVSDLYQTGEYKNISIIYNKFISTLVQKPTVKQLLPFVQSGPSSPGKEKMPFRADEVEPNKHLISNSSPQGEEGTAPTTDYLFEPTPELVLNHLIPRIIESQLYQAILESNAGEHSARMVTMKSATEAAGDIIADLTLTYNGLRQSKITTELSEITAGRIALE